MRVAVVVKRLIEDGELLSRMGWFIDCRIMIVSGVSRDLQSDPPFDLILCCGVSVPYVLTRGSRLIEVPALDYNGWSERSRRFVGRLIREGTEDLEIRFDKRSGRLIVESLVPF